MNREIKFRAWDKKENEMLNDFSTFTDDFTDIFNETIEYKKESLELMQYTWLKDKNWKEIYEGDIIATSNDWKDHADVWEQEIMWEVEFTYDWYTQLGQHDYLDSMYNKDYLEVIWNIYENPELIK